MSRPDLVPGAGRPALLEPGGSTEWITLDAADIQATEDPQTFLDGTASTSAGITSVPLAGNTAAGQAPNAGLLLYFAEIPGILPTAVGSVLTVETRIVDPVQLDTWIAQLGIGDPAQKTNVNPAIVGGVSYELGGVRAACSSGGTFLRIGIGTYNADNQYVSVFQLMRDTTPNQLEASGTCSGYTAASGGATRQQGFGGGALALDSSSPSLAPVLHIGKVGTKDDSAGVTWSGTLQYRVLAGPE